MLENKTVSFHVPGKGGTAKRTHRSLASDLRLPRRPLLAAPPVAALPALPALAATGEQDALAWTRRFISGLPSDLPLKV